MRAAKGRLIALDGIDGAAILVSAHETLAGTSRALRGGVSRWDASGVFHELAMADEDAGIPSPRTLLLLYAADLAFRVRWEIGPSLAEGRTVVAAPYIDTAMAFGRAVGLPVTWLSNLFRFAPRPNERHVVEVAAARAGHLREGFVEAMCERWADRAGMKRQHIIRDVLRYLRAVQDRRRRS